MNQIAKTRLYFNNEIYGTNNNDYKPETWIVGNFNSGNKTVVKKQHHAFSQHKEAKMPVACRNSSHARLFPTEIPQLSLEPITTKRVDKVDKHMQ